MLQNNSKTLGFQKSMVYKTPLAGGGGGGEGGRGKPYLARGLISPNATQYLYIVDSRYLVFDYRE